MMELVMHTEKNDTVFHTEKTGMLRLVVEINVGGMTADVVDKVTFSFDDCQLKQVDLKCVHALTEPHLHDIHVVSNRLEVDQYIQEVISFYKGLDVPTTQILDSKGAIISMKAADAKKAIQYMPDHSKKWHNEIYTRTRSTDTAIQAQLNNLRREIKKVNEKFMMLKLVVNHVVDHTTLRIVHLKKNENNLNKHTTFNLGCHSHKEEDIEQLLQDFTKETMEIFRIKSEDKK
nr:hypothetical protein [Tanacetum cinerariifolium]